MSISFNMPTILASVFLLYLLICLLLYFFKSEFYDIHTLGFRKGYYFLFITILFVAFATGVVKPKDWQVLLQLAGIAIFIDLAIYQTPDILKIWSAEFQKSDYFRKTIKTTDKKLVMSGKKAKKFNSIVSLTDTYLENSPPIVTWKQYKRNLRSYIQLYSETFDLQVNITKMADLTSSSDELKASLGNAYHEMSSFHGLNTPVKKEEKELRDERIEELFLGLHVEIKGKENHKDEADDIMLFAYYGQQYNFLVSVVGTEAIPADGIDASLIMNMAYIFDWWHT